MRREGKDEIKRETPRMTRWMDQTNEMVGGGALTHGVGTEQAM